MRGRHRTTLQEPGHAARSPERAITVEAATALEYLRSFAGRSDLAPPTKLRTDSIATQSPVHNTDPEIEARNRFVYEQSLTDKPWNSIRKEIAAMPFKEDH